MVEYTERLTNQHVCTKEVISQFELFPW